MAKKFTYRLESLLKLKQQNTSIAKTEFANAANERYSKENQINDLMNYKSELNSVDLKNMKMADLIYLYNHKQSIVELTKKYEEQRIILLEKERVKQQKYLLALQEEKVLVKLKEKQKNHHNYLVQREEQIEMDEIGLKRKSELSNEL